MSVALCTPNDLWPVATQASLQSIDTPFSTRTVPVEHRAAGTHTVSKSSYPNGVLLIPTGHDPTGIPTVLPAVVTAEDECSVTLDPEDLEDYQFGTAIVFVG